MRGFLIWGQSKKRADQDRKNAEPRPGDQDPYNHHGETLKSQKLFHRANSIKSLNFKLFVLAVQAAGRQQRVVVIHQDARGRPFQVVELAALDRPEDAQDDQQYEYPRQQEQENQYPAHGAASSRVVW